MTREDYTKLALERYPKYRPLMETLGNFNHIDLVNSMIKELFLDRDMLSDLARETRVLLIILRTDGMLQWSK